MAVNARAVLSYERLETIIRERDVSPPRRQFRDVKNPFEKYNNKDFRSRYRFTKESALELCRMLDEDLSRPTARSMALPVHLQVLTALRFYANGAFQKLHGDDAGLSQASMCRIVAHVSQCLARRRGQFIKFPAAAAERQETAESFYQYSNFPGVIGAIDGTHIGIRNPGSEQGLYFINRKNLSSINVQVVCNNERQITNIVARWPGATHDSRIFNESKVKMTMERLGDDNCWLLGDSGYACLPYLMTPLLNPSGRAEIRYNAAHKRARCIIERLFGMWKRRFPCLNKLYVKLDTVLAVIVACAVLWNLSIARGDPDFGGAAEVGDNTNRPHPGATTNVTARAGQMRRQRIIQEHFS